MSKKLKRYVINNFLKKLNNELQKYEFFKYFFTKDKITKRIEATKNKDIIIYKEELFNLFESEINMTKYTNEEFLEIFLETFNLENEWFDQFYLKDDKIFMKKLDNLEEFYLTDIINFSFKALFSNILFLHYINKLKKYNILILFNNALDEFFLHNGKIKYLSALENTFYDYKDENLNEIIKNVINSLKLSPIKTSVNDFIFKIPFKHPFRFIKDNKLYIFKEHFNLIQYLIEFTENEENELYKYILKDFDYTLLLSDYYIERYKNYKSNEISFIPPFIKTENNYYIFDINFEYQKINNLKEKEKFLVKFLNYKNFYIQRIFNFDHVYTFENKYFNLYPELIVLMKNPENDLEITYNID